MLDERFLTHCCEPSSGLALGFTFSSFAAPNPKRGGGGGEVRVSGRTRHSNTLTSTQGHVNKEIANDKGRSARIEAILEELWVLFLHVCENDTFYYNHPSLKRVFLSALGVLFTCCLI